MQTKPRLMLTLPSLLLLMLLSGCGHELIERTVIARPSAEADICIADFLGAGEYPEWVGRALVYYTYSCTE